MTKQDYELQLKKIISELQAGRTEGIAEQLEELYAYKPVRLLWYVARGWLSLVTGEAKAIEDVIPSYYCKSIPNEGLKEWQELHQKMVHSFGTEEEQRHLNYLYGDLNEKEIEEKRLEEALHKYFEEQKAEQLAVVMQDYLNIEEKVLFYLVRMFLIKSGFIKEDNKTAWYHKEKNFGYLEERVLQSKDACLFIEEEKNQLSCNLIAMLLHLLGHPVYILANPMEFEGVDIHSEEVLRVCFENIQQYEDSIVIPVCQKSTLDGKRENNRGEILRYLYENELEGNYGILFASGTAFYELSKNSIIQKNIDCLCEYNELECSDKMQFGWLGDYQSYISNIYGFDVKERISEKSECDFSIVVPARNSAETLYYTLQSCLR